MRPCDTHPLLISGAMEVEVALLLEHMEQKHPRQIGNYAFWQGELCGKPVVICRTGIGMANAAAATALGIHVFSPCAIVNQGTAGGHSLLVHRGDVVLGTSCVNITSFETPAGAQGDGCHPELWKPCTFEELDGPAATTVTGDIDLLRLAEKCPYEHGRIFRGILGSGDVWNREADRILWLNQNLHTMCEDMESFSAGYVAHQAHIPFLGVRVISNHEIHGEDFDRNTAEFCQRFLFSLISNLP